MITVENYVIESSDVEEPLVTIDSNLNFKDPVFMQEGNF